MLRRTHTSILSAVAVTAWTLSAHAQSAPEPDLRPGVPGTPVGGGHTGAAATAERVLPKILPPIVWWGLQSPLRIAPRHKQFSEKTVRLLRHSIGELFVLLHLYEDADKGTGT